MNASLKSFCLSLEEANYSSYYATQNTGWWTEMTSAPCCKVPIAQVFYRPNPLQCQISPQSLGQMDLLSE